MVVDQAAVPSQSQVGEVRPRVQEAMDIKQQPKVTNHPKLNTAGGASQEAAPVVTANPWLPADTARLLARLQLLLSETELAEFNQLISSDNYTEKNPPYQPCPALPPCSRDSGC